jgi:hypothetical protein
MHFSVYDFLGVRRSESTVETRLIASVQESWVETRLIAFVQESWVETRLIAFVQESLVETRLIASVQGSRVKSYFLSSAPLLLDSTALRNTLLKIITIKDGANINTQFQ